MGEASLLNQKDLTGSRYVDLGAIPTAAEERTATHMQVDEPPPMDVSESPLQQPGTSSGARGPDTRTRAREEPDGERPPDRSTPEDSSDSSSDSSSTSSSDEEPEPQRTPPTRQNTPHSPQPQTTPPQQQPTATADQRGPGLSSGPRRELSRPSRSTTTTESKTRDRSRSPRAVHLRTLHVENLKAAQGENANDVYFAQLTKKGKKK